jgi:hypothetical protein
MSVVWLSCVGTAIGVTLNVIHRGTFGADAHAYWLTGHRAHLYSQPPKARDAYLYSPAFAQLIWPLTKLPWMVFRAAWMLGEGMCFAWLLRPLGWAWGVPIFALNVLEIGQGNIWGFLGVTLIVSLHRAEYCALPLLTKVTLNLVPFWLAARRRWRAVAVSVAAPAVIAAASFAISPHDWTAWTHLLTHSGRRDHVLPVRVAVGIFVTLVASRLRQPWMLAGAVLIAAPVIHGLGIFSILSTLPRLVRSRDDLEDRRTRPVPDQPIGAGPR